MSYAYRITFISGAMLVVSFRDSLDYLLSLHGSEGFLTGIRVDEFGESREVSVNLGAVAFTERI